MSSSRYDRANGAKPPRYLPALERRAPSSDGAIFVGGRTAGGSIKAPLPESFIPDSVNTYSHPPCKTGRHLLECIRSVRIRDVAKGLGALAVVGLSLRAIIGIGTTAADLNDQTLAELKPDPNITAVELFDGAVLRDDRFNGGGRTWLSQTDRAVEVPDNADGSPGSIILEIPGGVEVHDGGTYMDYGVQTREWYAMPTASVIESLVGMNSDGHYEEVLEGLRNDHDGVTNVASDLVTALPSFGSGDADLFETN